MMKKYFCLSAIVVVLLAVAPTTTHAGWFGNNALLASVESFLQSIFSSVFNEKKSTPSENKCLPPVSQKPEIRQNALGRMVVTPETSEASKENTITVSLTTKIDALSVEINSDIWFNMGKNNIVDWGPKQAELPLGGKGVNVRYGDPFTNFIRWETHDYIDANKRLQKPPRLPARTYWVTVKATQQTISSRSDENTGAYGWKEVRYGINYAEGDLSRQEHFKSAQGNNFFYVGGPQFPVMNIVRVGRNSGAYYGKKVIVNAGDPFEVEARSIGWQGGTMTIDPGLTARIIGEKNIVTKFGETAMWRLLPRGTYPVEGKIIIQNECNSKFPQRFTDSASFSAPIIYDFKNVAKEHMRLTFQGGTFVLDFQKPQNTLTIIPWLSLMDNGVFVAPTPDQQIEMRAVYKDKPQEEVKNISIAPRKITTDKEGTAKIKIQASKITKQELSRGILIQASAPNIPGLVGQVELLFTNVVIDITPRVEQKIEAPQLSESAKIVSLILTPGNVGTLSEGDTIQLKTTLKMSDGSAKDVSGKTTFVVIGKIGTISPNGIFMATLDPEIAEYGEGIGAIVATHHDENGKEWIAQTNTFKVNARTNDQERDG